MKMITDFQDLAPTAARCNLPFALGEKEKLVLSQLIKWVPWISMTDHDLTMETWCDNEGLGRSSDVVQ